jgi:hypothetical protein
MQAATSLLIVIHTGDIWILLQKVLSEHLKNNHSYVNTSFKYECDCRDAGGSKHLRKIHSVISQKTANFLSSNFVHSVYICCS